MPLVPARRDVVARGRSGQGSATACDNGGRRAHPPPPVLCRGFVEVAGGRSARPGARRGHPRDLAGFRCGIDLRGGEAPMPSASPGRLGTRAPSGAGSACGVAVCNVQPARAPWPATRTPRRTALNRARTNGAVPAPGGSNREVSARRGSSRAPQCPGPPESRGPETALARREPGKLPDQDPYDDGFRHECCPRADPQEICPSGRISC